MKRCWSNCVSGVGPTSDPWLKKQRLSVLTDVSSFKVPILPGIPFRPSGMDDVLAFFGPNQRSIVVLGKAYSGPPYSRFLVFSVGKNSSSGREFFDASQQAHQRSPVGYYTFENAYSQSFFLRTTKFLGYSVHSSSQALPPSLGGVGGFARGVYCNLGFLQFSLLRGDGLNDDVVRLIFRIIYKLDLHFHLCVNGLHYLDEANVIERIQLGDAAAANSLPTFVALESFLDSIW
jgi:hypothetical protein